MVKIPFFVIFIVIIIGGSLAIVVAYEFVFDTFDIPHNENFAENRIKRFTEPLNWIEDRFTKNSPIP